MTLVISRRFNVLVMVSVKRRPGLGLDGLALLCSRSFVLDTCFRLRLAFSERALRLLALLVMCDATSYVGLVPSKLRVGFAFRGPSRQKPAKKKTSPSLSPIHLLCKMKRSVSEGKASGRVCYNKLMSWHRHYHEERETNRSSCRK